MDALWEIWYCCVNDLLEIHVIQKWSNLESLENGHY